MPFVAGNEIQAFCSNCGKDTNNTVIEVHEGLVFTVRCMECKETYQYQRPHGPPRPEKEAKPPKKPRSTTKRTKKKKAEPAGPPREWDDLVLGQDPEMFVPYSMKESFQVNDLLLHGKFGQGVVTEVRPDDKIDVAFREGHKILVHQRV